MRLWRVPAIDVMLVTNGAPVSDVEQARNLVARAGKSVALLLERLQREG